jgi:hypothetical protein
MSRSVRFQLTRMLPDGTVKVHPMPFLTRREANTAAAFSLYDNGAATKAEAQRFAAVLGKTPVGEPVMHKPSGYVFLVDLVSGAES